MTSKLLHDRVVVVTGGSSGNGRAIALAAAEQGARAVIIADVVDTPREGGTPTHELVQAESVFVPCDVSNADDVRGAVEAANRFGGVDVMVNNAGIVGPASPLVDMDPDAFDHVLAVNLRGTFLGCQMAGIQMVERGSGSIVNIASVAAVLGSKSSHAYSATKAGVRLMTATLAYEMGPRGVRANAVLPGVIETAMTTQDRPLAGEQAEATIAKIPLKRLGAPADIANVVMFLASDLAAYVTGTSVVVDGGMTSCMP